MYTVSLHNTCIIKDLYNFTGNSSVTKPRVVVPSSGGGATAIGPTVSEESETAAPVSKQEQQMLRVG